MRKNEYLVNILLGAVMAVVMLWCMVAKLIWPVAVMPARNIPNLMIACTIALVLAQYLNPGAAYNWLCAAFLAGLTLGLFPFVAGVAEVEEIWKLVLVGGLVFLGCERMFHSVMDRLSSGPAGKLAPLSVGLVMVVMSQIFAGMIL